MDVLLFLNGVLLSRLVYILNDAPLSGRTLTIVSLVQVALCLLVFAVGWLPIVLAALVLLVLLASAQFLGPQGLSRMARSEPPRVLPPEPV